MYNITYIAESKYVPNIESHRVKQNVNPEEYVEYNIEDIETEIVQSLKKFERDQGLKANVTANEGNDKNKNSTEETTQKDEPTLSEVNFDGTERDPWDLDDLKETLVSDITELLKLIQNQAIIR